jgi:hypothetical protein
VHNLNQEITLAKQVQKNKNVSEYEAKAREWVDDIVVRGQRHLDMLPNRPMGFMHALQRKGLTVVKGKVRGLWLMEIGYCEGYSTHG